MRCRSCNVLNMHALGKRVTQISMIARAVAGVNEVNCLGMLGCGMWGQLLIGVPAPLAFFNHAPEEFEKAARSRTIKPVKPHGKPGGIQRTPLHACDKAANPGLVRYHPRTSGKGCA